MRSRIFVWMIVLVVGLSSCSLSNQEKVGECTVEVQCENALTEESRGELTEGQLENLPENGILLKRTTVTIFKDDSVFDVLQRVCERERLHQSYKGDGSSQTTYVDGIGNLYEKDCGPQSGWVYSINGEPVRKGATEYKVENGDTILWEYTCNLGKDLTYGE